MVHKAIDFPPCRMLNFVPYPAVQFDAPWYLSTELGPAAAVNSRRKITEDYPDPDLAEADLRRIPRPKRTLLFLSPN